MHRIISSSSSTHKVIWFLWCICSIFFSMLCLFMMIYSFIFISVHLIDNESERYKLCPKRISMEREFITWSLIKKVTWSRFFLFIFFHLDGCLYIFCFNVEENKKWNTIEKRTTELFWFAIKKVKRKLLWNWWGLKTQFNNFVKEIDLF